MSSLPSVLTSSPKASPEAVPADADVSAPDPEATNTALIDIIVSQQREIDRLRERLEQSLGQRHPSFVEEAADPPPSSSPPAALTERTNDRPPSSTTTRNTHVVQVVANVLQDQALPLAFDALVKGLTTQDDVRNLSHICKIINPIAWQQILAAFFKSVVASLAARSPHLRLRDEETLPDDWFHEPWYNLYVQYTGVPANAKSQSATFDDLIEMIPYFRNLGFRNLCLLPHYESPMGDAGYDISDYLLPRKTLGGSDAYQRFMHAAEAAGLRIATDAVFNHTSTEHSWFQAALKGDEKYIAYYVQRNGREKIEEWDRDGDIVCRYRDPDGTVTERVCIFPDMDRTHGLWAEINGKTYQFYREFYPFQVDLNLQNPDVLEEIFAILGSELNDGVLAKRMDAVAHWIKKPGTSSEGLPETHALQALLKAYLRHICPHAVVIPEVVRNLSTIAEYAGVESSVNSRPCPSEGDALLAFEMQAALRETIYFQTVAPFWKRVFLAPRLPLSCVWLNLLDHHDETYLGFFSPEVRLWMRDYIQTRHGVLYKNGMSAGSRLADCLDNNPSRIATALFTLYITPGVPFLYAGVELGLGHNAEHAKRAMTESYERLQKLGVYAPLKQCFDPRELQRGPIPRAAFKDALENNYLPLKTLQKLNALRRAHPSLSAVAEVHPVDSGDIGVLCLTRQHGNDDHLLCIANLTPFRKEIITPVWPLRQRLGLAADGGSNGRKSLKLVNLLTEKVESIERDHLSYRLAVDAFGHALFKVEQS